MATFNLTDADAILKNIYLPAVREQINTTTPLLAEMTKKTESFEGRQWIMAIHTRRNEGIGARTESGSLPTPGTQKYANASGDPTYQYGRIELTNPAMVQTKSDKGSFVRALESETKGLAMNLKEDFNRQLAGNYIVSNTEYGGNGALAQVADAEASGQTVLSLEAGPFNNAASFRRVRTGMLVDIYKDVDGTPTLIADGVEVTAVSAGTSVTIASAISADADDSTFIYRAGNKGNEVTGIPAIVDDTGDLHGVSVSSYPVWKATVKDNSGTERAISEDLVQQLLDDIDIACGEPITHLAMEHTQKRKLFALLQSQKRSVNTLDLKGGYKAITFNDNIPIMVDRYLDSNRIYGLNYKHLFEVQLTDWEWADDDGSVLKPVSGKPNWEAWMYKYCDFATDRRNAHGLLDDLAD